MSHAGHPFSVRSALRAVFHDLRATSTTSAQRRHFHDYFVTHLPSSSLSPDKSHPSHHKLPRSDSQPHQGPSHRSTQLTGARDTTVVRIPLKSAKHHYGAWNSRGSRPYNEDTYQAGTLEIPAFAKKQPISLSRRPKDVVGAPAEGGDPQVFYFGVFDGHGGAECSEFLRDRLHGYLEEAALLFGMKSTLRENSADDEDDYSDVVMGEQDAEGLQMSIVSSWRETVGGYFKRFKPEYFPALHRGDDANAHTDNNSIETVLTYTFLNADLDFTTAQAAKHTASKQPRPSAKTSAAAASSLDDDRPLNADDILTNDDRPASQNFRHRAPRGSSPNLDAPIGGQTRFAGGSTASALLISTPTDAPFWHPASPSTVIAAHVGDTRILLCRTSDGKAVPLTENHHPSLPAEAGRLRRYAGQIVTDSFGEERVLGLANSRAFGDVGSKRIGVSAEPQITTMHLTPASYSFVVLVSDGVSGHLGDQEIVDVVKEAKTPEAAARALVGFAVETAPGGDADNATAVVVRLGGWERRGEGGGGSLGTREQREYRRREAEDPRRGRM